MLQSPISRSASANTAQVVDTLEQDGYCIVPNLIDPTIVAAIAADLAPRFAETPVSRGPFYGGGTKRVHGLLTKSDHAHTFIQHPLVLEVMDRILGPYCDHFQLNLTQAIEILPGSTAQPPHRDQDMWNGPVGTIEYLVNVMWPFTPYTRENGATMLWPGTHKDQDNTMYPEGEAHYGVGDPGSAVFFLGSVQHSGGANTTSVSRRGMIISYSLGWLKPYELQTLTYPPEIARTFPRELAELIGYRIHRPNLGYVHGVCPSALLDADFGTKVTGAVDYLTPGHEMLIDMWRDDMLEVGA